MNRDEMSKLLAGLFALLLALVSALDTAADRPEGCGRGLWAVPIRLWGDQR
jgi:hypothetical protein